MKKLILIALLAKVGFLCLSSCDPGEGVHNLSKEDLERMKIVLTVGFDPAAKENNRAFVKIAFTKPISEDLLFTLPEKFLRKQDLYTRITNLKVASGRGEIVKTSRKNLMRLVANNDERIVLQYNILGIDPRFPFKKPSFSAPIVLDDYLLFAGSQGLVFPAIQDGIEIPLTFKWEIPTDYDGFTNLNISKHNGKIYATYNSLYDSMFVAGNGLKLLKRTIKGNILDVVIKGNFTHVTDAQIAQTLEDLLTRQRDDFDDHSSSYFLASFYGREGPCPTPSKIQGTAHVNSFRSVFYADCRVSAAGKILVSHELMHNWIGKKLNLKSKDGQHGETKWFSEGFTDFFGRVMALKAGVITKDEYVDSLNDEQLIPYYRSENRNKTLRYVAQNMYSRSLPADSDLSKIPYKQGEIMALTLNEAIYNNNNSYGLIDVMREALKKVQNIPYDGTLKSRVFLEHAEFEKILDKYASGVFAPEYEKIVKGETLVIPELRNCVQRSQGTNERIWGNSAQGIANPAQWLFMDENNPKGFYWYNVRPAPPAPAGVGACNQLLK